jgi:outer membrane protease
MHQKEKTQMKASKQTAGAIAIIAAASIALPSIAQEKAAEEKKAEPAKAKAEKVAGDIGLLDAEKNYMIVVTKEGKLITLDFNAKTKATEIVETKVKMGDVGLGSSANIEYVTKGEKNFLSKMTFVPAKGE